MASFDTNDPRDEALWDLLGKARDVEASPYFARKVLRAVESADEPRPALSLWRTLLRVVAPAAVCAGIAVLAVAGGNNHRLPAVAKSDIEFETIQNLDLLVSNYESSLWLDSSSR